MSVLELFRSPTVAKCLRCFPRVLTTSQYHHVIIGARIPYRPLPFLLRKSSASQSFHACSRFSARPPEYERRRFPRYGPRQEQLYHQQQQQQQQRQQYEQEYQQQYEQQQKRLPPNHGRSFVSSLTATRIALVACPSAIIFYFANLETVPVSGRRRFNCFNPSSAEAQGEIAYKQILQQEGSQGKILPEWDPRSRMVKRVMKRLIDGGKLGTGTTGEQAGWDINVIDDPSVKNAFVLPGGKVFVYTGILPICRNDAGLAAVLGHEAAHNICQHTAERMSSVVYLQPLIWSLVYVDLLVFGTPAGLGHLVGGWLLDILISKPGSRQQESEADHVGLMLMAQACYDPNEAPKFWERMERANELAPPEWLSTHPSNEHRIQNITRLLPKAEEERSKSGCGLTTNYAEPFKRAVQDTFFF